MPKTALAGLAAILAASLWMMISTPTLPTTPLVAEEKIILANGNPMNIQERMNFINGRFTYTRSWTNDNSRDFIQIAGNIDFKSRNHAVLTVDDRSSSENPHTLSTQLSEDLFFNQLNIQAKNASLNIKILRNDEKGFCFYFYLGRSVQCFGTSLP